MKNIIFAIAGITSMICAIYQTGTWAYNIVQPDSFIGIIGFMVLWSILMAAISTIGVILFIAIQPIFKDNEEDEQDD